MKKIIKLVGITYFLIIGVVFAQINSPRKNAKDLIRQYGFSVFSVADAYSDSIRILNYLSIPNHVLQFIKTNDGFNAEYEVTLSLKKKKGSQVGRKHWAKSLQTEQYLESTSKEIFTIHFHEFKVPADDYIISAELLDRDSNDSGVRNKELKLKKHQDDITLYTPFFLDYLSGRWGLNDNEIPLFQSMLGEKLGQIIGPIKTTVLPANGPNPRFENSVEGSGTLAGVDVNCMATYSSEMQSDGSLYGECPNQGVIMTANGEVATFRATGVGKFNSEGGIDFGGVVYFRTSTTALESLNSAVVVYTFKIDANNVSTWDLWEWKY